MQSFNEPTAGKFDFVITLQSPGYRYINAVSQLLLLLFLATYFMYLFQLGMFGKNLWLLIIPVLIIGLWLYGWVRRADKTFEIHYRTELMIAAMSWILMPLYEHHVYIGWGYALMAVIERYIKVPDEIGFSTAEVVRNSLPKKHYEWIDIDNVVIRDNLFTLDLRNNKIIQKPLQQPIAPELETEFNEFCKNQLHFKL